MQLGGRHSVVCDGLVPNMQEQRAKTLLGGIGSVVRMICLDTHLTPTAGPAPRSASRPRAVLQQLPVGISVGSGSCPSSYQPPRSYTRDAGQHFQASVHPHRQFLWAISTTVFSALRTAATSSIGVGRRGTQNVQIHLSVAAHPELVLTGLAPCVFVCVGEIVKNHAVANGGGDAEGGERESGSVGKLRPEAR